MKKAYRSSVDRRPNYSNKMICQFLPLIKNQLPTNLGRSEVIDTWETHPWIAANARNKKVQYAFTICNNLVYQPMQGPNGGKYTLAEIRRAPG